MNLLLIAVLASYGLSLAWMFCLIAGLRFVGIKLPFTYAFRFFKRADLVSALKGRPKEIYLRISFLLSALPVIVALTAFDLIEHRYYEHVVFGTSQVAFLILWLVIISFADHHAASKAWR